MVSLFYMETNFFECKLFFAEQMDQLLENCFYQAMIDAKKIELPVLVTTFSAQFLHPAW